MESYSISSGATGCDPRTDAPGCAWGIARRTTGNDSQRARCESIEFCVSIARDSGCASRESTCTARVARTGAHGEFALFAFVCACDTRQSASISRRSRVHLSVRLSVGTDLISRFRCMSQLGMHHSSLVQPLVEELLNVHPLFETPEPRIEDVFCMSPILL